jgi:hypothetical protein
MNFPRAGALILLAAPLAAEERALLSAREVAAFYTRVVQLMESTTAAVPGLARAGALVIENARQALESMRSSSAGLQDATLHHGFHGSVRAFLGLADTMPKPFPRGLPRRFHHRRLAPQ